MKNYKREFTPIEVSKELKVTNKTVINRLATLVKNGFVVPHMVKERIRSYELSDYTKQNEKRINKWRSCLIQQNKISFEPTGKCKKVLG